MSIRRASRSGLVLWAIALLMAGCSGSGSGSSSSPAPRGIAGVTDGNGLAGSHGKHHSQKAKSAKRKHQRRGSSTSASGSAGASALSTAAVPRPRSSSPALATTSASRTSTSSRSKPPPTSGPTVAVTPHTGLRDGQTVIVEGFGFKPNVTLVVAECRDRGQQTDQSDCNVRINLLTGSYGPAKKVTSDANGHVSPVQLVVAKTFKTVNCAVAKCLVAISEPTLNPDPTDEGDQYIKFG